MQPEDVHLGLFSSALGHCGASFVVDVEHQLGRLLDRIPEQLLQHPGDVTHQIDRVVPHDDHPRPVHLGGLIGFDLGDGAGVGRRHCGRRLSVAQTPDGAGRARRPASVDHRGPPWRGIRHPSSVARRLIGRTGVVVFSGAGGPWWWSAAPLQRSVILAAGVGRTPAVS